MVSLLMIIDLVLDVVLFVIIAHIIMSWLLTFGVLNTRQPIVMQLWDGLTRLLEPIYAPVRRVLPQTGGLDLAPLVVILGIYAIRIIIANNASAFV